LSSPQGILPAKLFYFLKNLEHYRNRFANRRFNKPCGGLLVSPHEKPAIWTEAAMRRNQLACEALDLERSVMRLGEQLRRQFSEVTLEPLPEDMLVLLEELSQAAE
jgi:hypothetical protein